jgi:replicative DNA helicase
LRPSGVIEAEADVILFLYPKIYSFNGRNKTEKDSEILVRIGKNRMGQLETFLFRSEFHIQKISEYTGLF